MENTEIIIIGAGAAGLMAACELSKAGKKITILEARNRAGGRVHTINAPFSAYGELGAEFVHGDLPLTLQLLKEAGIEATPAGGQMWQHHNGQFKKEYQQINHWDLLIKELGKLEQDTTIGDFLQEEFGGDKYAELRTAVSKYVAGYDTADPFRASAFGLRTEWQNEDQGAQHRVKGGYNMMIDYLVDESRKHGARLCLNSVAKQIHWEDNLVEVITADKKSYKGAKLIIALPLGVLQAAHSTQAGLKFNPSVPIYSDAVQQIGFGAIIKVLLEFKSAFWQDNEMTELAGHSLKEMSFLLSDEEVPTWWTQFPEHSSLLTGWLGGPAAERKMNLTNEEVLQQSLASLGKIFKKNVAELQFELAAWKVVNWTTDPFTLGSYSYDTIEAPAAREILTNPINSTIYFAGEYLYDGPAMGTLEAALTSGQAVTRNLLR